MKITKKLLREMIEEELSIISEENLEEITLGDLAKKAGKYIKGIASGLVLLSAVPNTSQAAEKTNTINVKSGRKIYQIFNDLVKSASIVRTASGEEALQFDKVLFEEYGNAIMTRFGEFDQGLALRAILDSKRNAR